MVVKMEKKQKLQENVIKKLIKEEIKVFLHTLTQEDKENVFQKTSQLEKDIKNGMFDNKEARKFQKIYEVAISLMKTNLAALYFLELLQKTKFLTQLSQQRDEINMLEQIKKLIPYFMKVKNGEIYVIKELTPQEEYWVKILYNTIGDNISYSTVNQHGREGDMPTSIM